MVKQSRRNLHERIKVKPRLRTIWCYIVKATVIIVSVGAVADTLAWFKRGMFIVPNSTLIETASSGTAKITCAVCIVVLVNWYYRWLENYYENQFYKRNSL